MYDDDLNDKNFVLYAAKNYINPRLLSLEEFHEDFARFKYIKKLFTKYRDGGKLQHRLILNHLINIYNVFDFESSTRMCFFKIPEESWGSLKSFLLYLDYIKEDEFKNINEDLYVTEQLRNI